MKYLSMAALLMAGVAFTSCSSDDDAIAEPQQSENAGPKTYTLTIQAGKGGDAAGVKGTRALALDGSTLNATWAIGEEVTVYNVTTKKDLEGVLTADRDGVTTLLSGTLTGTINVGDDLELRYQSLPDYTAQTGTFDNIASSYDYAVATIKVGSLTGDIIRPEGGGVATFVNQQAIIRFTLTEAGNSSAINANSLNINVGGTSYTFSGGDGKNVYYLAASGATSVITFTATVNGTPNTYYYYTTGSAVTFSNGKYYEIPVAMTALLNRAVTNTTEGINFVDGETWAQAIANHPAQNTKWSVSDGKVYYNSSNTLYDGEDVVSSIAAIVKDKTTYNVK